jgi:hypothetical protein
MKVKLLRGPEIARETIMTRTGRWLTDWEHGHKNTFQDNTDKAEQYGGQRKKMAADEGEIKSLPVSAGP